MLLIAGTVHNAVKLAELDHKWQQKKESGSIFQADLSPEERQLEFFKQDIQKMRESDVMTSISSKMQSGGELTHEELEYLQKHAPELYQEYMKSQQEKEAYNRQLKNCKTKEEVDRLKVNKLNGYLAECKNVTNNPNIPKSKKLEVAQKLLMKTMGIEAIHVKFIASGQYEALPTEEEIAEEARDEAKRAEAVTKELGSGDEMTGKQQEEVSGEQIEAAEEQQKQTDAVEEESSNGISKAEKDKEAEAFAFPEEKKRKKKLPTVQDGSYEHTPVTGKAYGSAEIDFVQVRTELFYAIKASGATGIGCDYSV